MPDEIILLRQFIHEGSQQAFSELVRARIDFVFALALRRVGGDVQGAEDITQQVFVALARSAPSLAKRDDLAGWWYKSTRFIAAKYSRAWSRRQARETNLELVTTLHSETHSGEDIDARAIEPSLMHLLDRLPEPERKANPFQMSHCASAHMPSQSLSFLASLLSS